jgi:molybdate transport system ATP-binding protein
LPLAFRLIFLLDRAFFFLYSLSIKKKILLKKNTPMNSSALPFFSLRNASFRLGNRIVFRNTSWVFHRNEHWAIIGVNGSGKSILGEALRGGLPLVHGELIYHFRLPPGLLPEEAIGQVSFEDRKFDVHETVVQSRWNSIEEESALLVRDFLSYERVMEINPFEVKDRLDQGRRAYERRMHRAVNLLRIGPFLDRTLISLSNGERQRVQMGRALCRPLRLLIVDELFMGLDTEMRHDFHVLLERLMRTPLRVLFLTTRIDDVPRLVTHLLCVHECRVIAMGPLTGVLSHPRVKRIMGGGRRRRAGYFAPGAKPMRELDDGGISSRKREKDGLSYNEERNTGGKRLVQLRHVTVRYGRQIVLRDINWTILSGESWALLGPNGSGKTTLLSLILGDNPQAYGNDIVLFGKKRGSGESVWGIKRRMGWVSPELHLHFNDEATCFEVAVSGFYDSIGLFQRPSRRQRNVALDWLEKFQVLEFADSPLCGLSTGLQRMVLLARALVKRPQLLILDEPCQGLDPAHRDIFVNAVDELIQAGKVTTIYVTHRKEEIPRGVKRVLLLEKGVAQSTRNEQGQRAHSP